VGGLPTLLALLSDADAGVRSRAAAVLGACAQNNAPTQQVLIVAPMPA
jgi:HEAT repeat protein